MELAEGNEVLSEQRHVSLKTLLAEVRHGISGGPRGRAVVARDAEEAIGGAAHLAASGERGVVLHRSGLTAELRERLVAEGLLASDGGSDSEDLAEASGPEGEIGIFTSGTTGRPKLVWHSWQTLFTMPRQTEAASRRWLLAYQPGTYAWWQVVTLALFVNGQHLVVSDDVSPGAVLERGREEEATAISSTPTFWRVGVMAVGEDQLRSIPLRQITLGGEPVGQDILDLLRSLYPDARIHHIYASTEAGAAIVVRDGREGFPASWLEDRDVVDDDAADPSRPRLVVREGRLFVRSPWTALDQGEWVDTGDRVEVQGDRAVVVGREGRGMINVGGAKVNARTVEEALMGHPAVHWCRVRGEDSPVTGQMVAADLVAPPGASPVDDHELTAWVRERVPETWIPRFIEWLDAIPTSNNFKSG